MKTCDHQLLVVDYFFDELDQDRREQLKNHISGCKICQEQFNALTSTSKIVKQQKREQPEKELLNQYHLQLKNKFYNPKTTTGWLEKLLNKFVRRPSIAIRLAEAVVFILIGVFLGKTTIWNSDVQDQSVALNNMDYEFLADEILLKNYLQETEMILLDVANLDPQDDEQIIFNLIQSTKYKYLLQKTLLLRDQAKELENQQLSDLLNRIELIFLELCNMEKNAYVETLAIIKKQLKDSHLFIEMKSLNQI